MPLLRAVLSRAKEPSWSGRLGCACWLASQKGHVWFKKYIFALLSAINIDVKFLVSRLNIILWLVSPRQSGWIILYLESTSKSVCTCYRKHQPQIKHCPEESVSPVRAMGWMSRFPKKKNLVFLNGVSQKGDNHLAPGYGIYRYH